MRAWRMVCSVRRSTWSIVFVGYVVTYEFCVEVAGVVRRLEREAEVVHGKDVFEELGFLESKRIPPVGRVLSRPWAMALVLM